MIRRYAGMLLAAFGAALSLACGAQAATPEILLPAMRAVELPSGATSIAADEEPLRSLLAGARCPGFRLSVTLPRDRIGVGAWQAVWSARPGTADAAHSGSALPASAQPDSEHPGSARPQSDLADSARPDAPPSGTRPVARRGATIIVLPSGTTPVGLTADENATAGNNAAHIARDSDGHVHMLWVDSGRSDGLVGAIYRRAETAPDGAVRFATDAVELAGAGQGEWNAYPGLAVSDRAVDFVWQGGGTAHYRRLTHDGDAWYWSPPVDTAAPSAGRDVGPSIAAAGSAIHIVTPAGVYAHSADAGRSWETEALPLPAGTHVKTASIALDPAGHPLVVASIIVSMPGPLSEDHGSGGYWTLLLLRRGDDGRWQRLPSPVTDRPEWAPPQSLREDVLTDWARIAVDATGGLHVTWHGTAVSRIYANDRAYYAWRGPDGWSVPAVLRAPDPAREVGFSYAPSLALAGDMALVVPFYVRGGGEGDVYDADVLGFRAGAEVVSRRPVTRYMQHAIASGEPAWALGDRFPSAAPAVYHAPDGRTWLDLLETLVPVNRPDAAKLVVYQRLDLTDALRDAGR